MRLIDADRLTPELRLLWVCGNTSFQEGIEQAEKIISNAQTIEAEPVKTGKWINREVDHTEHMVADGTQTAKCSVCGKYHTTPYLYYFKNYAFCPNCGARMEAEE